MTRYLEQLYGFFSRLCSPDRLAERCRNVFPVWQSWYDGLSRSTWCRGGRRTQSAGSTSWIASLTKLRSRQNNRPRLPRTTSILGILCIIWITTVSPAHATPRGTLLREGTIPLFDGTHPKAALTVRVKHVFSDLQRLGFFRIGALPLIVAEDVEILILDPNRVHAAISRWPRRLPGIPEGTVFEIRRFRVRMFDEAEPRVEAALARLGKSGQLQLSGRIKIRTQTEVLTPSSGALNVVGAGAGCVRFYVSGGIHEADVFCGSEASSAPISDLRPPQGPSAKETTSSLHAKSLR